LEVYLDAILRTTTKKGRQFFGKKVKKVHPRQNPGYAYVFIASGPEESNRPHG